MDRRGYFWSREEEATLVKLLQNGKNVQYIANQFGRTDNAITCRIKKIILDEVLHKRTPLSDVAKMLNVSESHIKNIITEYIPPQQHHMIEYNKNEQHSADLVKQIDQVKEIYEKIIRAKDKTIEILRSQLQVKQGECHKVEVESNKDVDKLDMKTDKQTVINVDQVSEEEPVIEDAALRRKFDHCKRDPSNYFHALKTYYRDARLPDHLHDYIIRMDPESHEAQMRKVHEDRFESYKKEDSRKAYFDTLIEYPCYKLPDDLHDRLENFHYRKEQLKMLKYWYGRPIIYFRKANTDPEIKLTYDYHEYMKKQHVRAYEQVEREIQMRNKYNKKGAMGFNNDQTVF